MPSSSLSLCVLLPLHVWMSLLVFQPLMGLILGLSCHSRCCCHLRRCPCICARKSRGVWTLHRGPSTGMLCSRTTDILLLWVRLPVSSLFQNSSSLAVHDFQYYSVRASPPILTPNGVLIDVGVIWKCSMFLASITLKELSGNWRYLYGAFRTWVIAPYNSF